MQIQEAITAAKEGAIIYRPSYQRQEKPFSIPHYLVHIAFIEDEDEGRKFFVMRDQLPHPNKTGFSFQCEYQFSIEDILALDWEIWNDKCDCVECNPHAYQAHLKKGDLIEYWPCSGLRVIWIIENINDTRVSGNIYRVFEGDKEIPFEIIEPSRTIKFLSKFTYARNWVRYATVFVEYTAIYYGLLHNWPQYNMERILHCRLVGERLEQLRRWETEQRMASLKAATSEVVNG